MDATLISLGGKEKSLMHNCFIFKGILNYLPDQLLRLMLMYMKYRG